MTRPRFFAAFAACALVAVSLLAIPAQAAPGFKNISAIAAAANGNADPTVALPAHAAGDVLLLATIVRSGTATVAAPAGWTELGTATVRAGVATYQFFWIRASGTNSEADPVIDRTGTTGDVYAAVINYSGAITTGDPWEVKGTPATGTSDPAVCSGITTLSADSLVVAVFAGENNNNSAITATGANPAAYTEHYLESGVGNDGMIAFSEAVRTAAGATGNVSGNFNGGNPNGWGCVVLALAATPTPTLSSAANQTFTIGDPPTLASTLTVTDAATPTITASNDIRIRIPATFSMTWDTAVTTVTLGGGAAGKVSATLSAYEDSNKTAVLNVTSDFSASDQLTVAGLKFRDFTAAEAADNLELVVAGAGGATADADDKTITIANSGVRSAGSRILNDDASRTPVAAEDADVTAWDKDVKFLVTLGIQTTNGARCQGNQGTNRLQWRNVTDAPGTWNTLGTAAGPEMVLFDSANLVDNNALTLAEAQIAGSGGYINGKEAESNGNKSWSRFEDGEYSAIQLAIDPSAGVLGKTYQFRFVVNGSLCDAGSSVMSVSITLTAASGGAGGFNAYESSTAAGAITGVIKTKIAGGAAGVDMIALNTAKDAVDTGFAGPVRVELLDASDNSGALDANGCRSTWTVIQVLSPDPAFASGDNGRKTISVAEANSYRDARLRISYPAGAPTLIGCSTDNFAIRPNAFANFSVSDDDWETAGVGRALDDLSFTVPPPGGTGKVHKAGRPFSVRAQARNAASALTSNYSGTPTANLAVCAGAACTASVGTLTLGTAFVAGQLASDAATYDNVGSFALELVDAAFASVDAGDSSAAEREIRSAPINVGRFVPDHFAVLRNTPVLAPACGTFTYLGQAFNYTTAPVITVTAQDFANNTTALYAGNWWRLSNGTLTPATQAARYSAATGTPDTALLPAVASDPTIVPGAGIGTLGFSSGSGLAFLRPTTTPSAPVASFNAEISLAVNIIDADGVAYASNPARFGQAIAGSGIEFSDGNALTTIDKEMRFGRLRLENAVGSEKLNLPIPMRTEYWTGTAFQTNTADGCTSIGQPQVLFSDYQGGVTAGNMNNGNVVIGGNFSSGVGSLTLTAPGSTSPGAVTVTIDLDAAGRSYLKGNWGVTTFDANPTSRAAFGLYGSQPNNFIYFRENY